MIILTALMFGLLGLIAAWIDEALPSVLFSGLIGSVVSSIWILTNTTDKFAAATLLVVVFMPRVFFFLPFGGLVRWLIHKMEQQSLEHVAPARRIVPALLALIVMTSIGIFSILPKERRDALVKMESLLQTGMNSQAASRDELPKPLQAIEGFIKYADGEYYYIIGSDPDVLPVQRPMVGYDVPEPFIIVKFKNGFRFGCVFSPPYIKPACANF